MAYWLMNTELHVPSRRNPRQCWLSGKGSMVITSRPAPPGVKSGVNWRALVLLGVQAFR